MTVSISRSQVYIIQTCILSLVLSILVVALSLGIYSSGTVPVFNILTQFSKFQTMLAIVQDRQLIATLVASQASIFCRLFLLLNHSLQEHLYVNNNRSTDWRTVSERVCLLLMSGGLAWSWVLCILFDRQAIALALQQLGSTGDDHIALGLWPDMCVPRRELLDSTAIAVRSWWPYSLDCIIIDSVQMIKFALVLIFIFEVGLFLIVILQTSWSTPPNKESYDAESVNKCNPLK
ncbi:uncharacterized protein BYT42DRAFT_584937 [Radiomyces spectabilis]|uniref:uncharacterized protein n=1 Tax=Radiomyces spectabilis TaxID=64574 RepID=UPI00221F7B9F|nr:uncharacterized protein BYT42DRAFT_584937 [Radiomyces spectabilis]KAI8369567.1 hypothetical protein BYT42DRAFT_584937 [Radiomyces spectabilis]